MENLAGNIRCDEKIEKELYRSRIETIRLGGQLKNEVPASIIGKLGLFVFTRAWRYWVVRGLVPLNVAQELYEDPVGREDIRVAGHCGCPPPEKPWIKWMTADGRTVAPVAEEAKFDKLIEEHHLTIVDKERHVFSDNPESVGAKAYVDTYHIDTEVGLHLFADTIRKYGLDKTS